MKDNIKPTLESLKLSSIKMIIELTSEVEELNNAINKDDIENIGEELMDVIQWCVNIGTRYQLDINKEIDLHNKKLMDRGHKFVL